MEPGRHLRRPARSRQLGGRRRAVRLAALPRRRRLRARSRTRTVASGRSRQACARCRASSRPRRSSCARIRYGEADRILHLYSAIAGADRRDRQGRAQAALALRRAAGAVLPPRPGPPRGPRRPRDGDRGAHGRRASEPARRRRRRSAPPRAPATRSCACCDAEEPNPAAYNLLCRYLSILDGSESLDGDGCGDGAAGLATALAFRLKLALAAGFAPELASCARCGEADELVGFSGAAGGVVCARLRARRVPALARGARVHGRGARAARWRRRRTAGDRALRQAERAITETLEHHAHVQLRAAA